MGMRRRGGRALRLIAAPLWVKEGAGVHSAHRPKLQMLGARRQTNKVTKVKQARPPRARQARHTRGHGAAYAGMLRLLRVCGDGLCNLCRGGQDLSADPAGLGPGGLFSNLTLPCVTPLVTLDPCGQCLPNCHASTLSPYAHRAACRSMH